MSELTYQDVLRILDLISASDSVKFELESDGTRIKIERYPPDKRPPAERPSAPSSEARKPAPAEAPVGEAVATASAAEPVRPASPAPAEDFPAANPVVAPMVGVFYAAPEPGKPPFVEVGSEVRQGDQVGIIEVMKLFTPITAPCDGVVVSILVENQQSVAKDEVLMLVDGDQEAGGQ